ncbi:heavy metal translocating P-type ATPase [Riemerella columbipharyngis]|uniref:P-type Zn(2+) transporter n=1 Tax=Riemerella columbipharyngis TaxID=1071918 RepID=A0A1G7DQ82_9FLAO|nr:heavy metal translocating P-type ATPase [Riemerella columbipharyngis]SDE53589.1 Cd2+/Zn2+-exporting ATPase [Riemerella columbipharyngis]
MCQNEEHCCSTGQHQNNTHAFNNWIIFSFVLLGFGVFIDYYSKFYTINLPYYEEVEGFVSQHISVSVFYGLLRFLFYFIATLPVAYPVMKSSIEEIKNKNFFNEFTLMSVACIGAFALGEYSEALGVMLFYTCGEYLQSIAVKRARKSIKDLLSVKITQARVWRDGGWQSIPPKEVNIGDILEVRVGEKIPIDGKLVSDKARLNTAAITGESKPISVGKGEKIFSGVINLENVIQMEATTAYEDSSVQRILKIVEDASHRKAGTELMVRKLAKIYTPIVFALAVMISIVPLFLVSNYQFSEWFYRSLIFLVISCPCALVISIPLGYFGGLGAASKNGILFKGASYLEKIVNVDTLVVDKTGTLTKGVFAINKIEISSEYDKAKMMGMIAGIEEKSTHPIAKAITAFVQTKEWNIPMADEVKEIPGSGLLGMIEGKLLCIGNKDLLSKQGVATPSFFEKMVETIVFIAYDGSYVGYITIADKIKPDAKESITKLRRIGIKHFVMLSGDNHQVTNKIAKELHIEKAIGNLLPEDKLKEFETIKAQSAGNTAYMGDGINDAPVIASADIGISMGALGSDVAVETADVVIQNDEPSKLATAMKIGKTTRNIIWENIGLAFGVKIIILTLGTFGEATLWEAVFADVGVALLAVFNACRIQMVRFR